jgi:hypothetical protein
MAVYLMLGDLKFYLTSAGSEPEISLLLKFDSGSLVLNVSYIFGRLYYLLIEM